MPSSKIAPCGSHLSVNERLALFDWLWVFLAEICAVDDFNSAEYERVRREWSVAGHPLPVNDFIHAHTRVPSSPGG